MAIMNRFIDATTPYATMQDFSGGMNSQDNAIALPDNQLVEGTNIYGIEKGSACKRPGSEKDSINDICPTMTRAWASFRYYTQLYSTTVISVDTPTGGKIFQEDTTGNFTGI